jgi:hypothetical protein
MGQPMAHGPDAGKKVENADMINERKTLRKVALTVRFQRTMG